VIAAPAGRHGAVTSGDPTPAGARADPSCLPFPCQLL